MPLPHRHISGVVCVAIWGRNHAAASLVAARVHAAIAVDSRLVAPQYASLDIQRMPLCVCAWGTGGWGRGAAIQRAADTYGNTIAGTGRAAHRIGVREAGQNILKTEITTRAG